MELKKLSNNIYYMEFDRLRDRPVLGYILGDKFSIMIDGGNSKKHLEEFIAQLEKENLPYPKYSLITHWHWDHTFAMKFFKGESIVSRKTNDKLKLLKTLKWDEESILNRVETGEEIMFAYKAIKAEYDDFDHIRVETGDIIFEEKLELNLGNLSCEMILVGGPHEEDSSVIYIREEKVLFAGDAHSGDYYNNDGKIDSFKMKNYIEVLRNIDFETYILGHDNPITKKKIIEILEGLLNKI